MSRPLLVMVALMSLLAAAARAGVDSSRARDLAREFNESPRAIRPEFLDYPGYALHLDDDAYSCLVPMALRRLAEAGERFTIRKVHTRRDHFRVELATAGHRRFQVTVYDQGKLTQDLLDRGLPRLLGDMFEFGPAPAPVMIIGNRDSRMYHHDRCNHLPAAAVRQEFASRDAATDAGFRECPICFSGVMTLPFTDYFRHRTAGLEAAKRLELVYPPSDDAALQEELTRLGQEVLAGWPLDLAGFDYEFHVVQAAHPLAVGCATGIVIVSDTMLRSAEYPEEILFVLAHEIAHCELHLPPRSPFLDERPAPEEPGFAAYLKWGESIQLVADLVAVSWFRCQPEGHRDLARARGALAKIQQAANEYETAPDEDYRLYRRLWLFEPERYQAGDLRQVFLGRDGDGDIRYEVRPLGFLEDGGYINTYFLVATTDYQDKREAVRPATTGWIRIADNRSVEFAPGPLMVVPGHTVLLAGQAVFPRKCGPAAAATISRFSFDWLAGVRSWEIAGEDGGED